MNSTRDRVRVIVVAVLAVAQVVSSPLTTLALGPRSNTGDISDANQSPVTPAGYAFAIWGLIYLMSLGLAVYQALPTQQSREVHRRTGWWVAGAFAASTIWVPIFGSRTIWLSQLVIVLLVICLVGAARAFRDAGRADTTAERFLLRLPTTVYLGWATLATAAGFGVTFRSLGMPRSGGWVVAVSLLLIVAAMIASVIAVGRLVAVAGFAFTSGWALVAIAVGSYSTVVAVAAIVALAVVVAVLCVRAGRSPRKTLILMG